MSHPLSTLAFTLIVGAGRGSGRFRECRDPESAGLA